MSHHWWSERAPYPPLDVKALAVRAKDEVVQMGGCDPRAEIVSSSLNTWPSERRNTSMRGGAEGWGWGGL